MSGTMSWLQRLLYILIYVWHTIAVECPGQYDCSCSRSTTGEYELLCPRDAKIYVLSLHIKPGKSIFIQCTFNTHWSDYKLLNGLQVGPVTSVNFHQCPLPNGSIYDLTRNIGINSTTTLLFQSYRNLSNTLEKKHLSNLSNITRLRLSSNGLTDLPEDLLDDLNNLSWLDLRGNYVHIPKHFFRSTPKLEMLELGNNELKHLVPNVFENLTSLRVLNLWSNRLQTFSKNIFTNLTRLEALDIHSNNVESFPEDVFHELLRLKVINLFSNNFSSLPENLFSQNQKLEVVRLYDNKQNLTLPPKFLSNLTHLKEVYLMKNNLRELPEDIFWDSIEITNISLNNNLLKSLPYNVLRDQEHLRLLDLSYNFIKELPDGLFRSLANLRVLSLGYNKLVRISRLLLTGLVQLEQLDLEHNELNYMDAEAFAQLEALKHARLSHNFLSFLNKDGFVQGGLQYTDYFFGNRSPFQHCIKLEYLYLTNNSITEIFSDWQILLSKLRVLDLSYNRINSLNAQDIHFISRDISVDLRFNNITTLNLQGIETLALSQTPISPIFDPSRRIPRVLVDNNPLHCDCLAYDLSHYVNYKLVPEVYTLVNLVPGNLTCASPDYMRGKMLISVDSRELMCPYTKDECPTNCLCMVRPADRGLVINCSGRGLNEVPKSIPKVNYVNHTELYLEDNHITALPNVTLPGYSNVTQLFLSGNQLNQIEPSFISEKLDVLTLDRNNISRISSQLVKQLSNSSRLRILTLHGNPWICDCTGRELLNLVQFKFRQIPFLWNLTCTVNGNQKQISKLSISDLCHLSTGIIIACGLVATLAVLLGGAAALYYRYQHEIHVWLYAHKLCLWLVTEEELDKDKLYDVFVSYSNKDENFVINELVPRLETGENRYKLCLHYRDWIAGEWIPNQIARSVEDSRRTLVVLSPNFLESVWGRMEFRAAHKQALNEGRARVIMLLLEDVGPTEKLDPELKAYISMNTYLKWGDPWFWEKLRYALPHPPHLLQKNLGLLKRRNRNKEKKFIDDRLELIHTLDSPTTPPGGTTPPIDTLSPAHVPNGKIVSTPAC